MVPLAKNQPLILKVILLVQSFWLMTDMNKHDTSIIYRKLFFHTKYFKSFFYFSFRSLNLNYKIIVPNILIYILTDKCITNNVETQSD